MALVSGCALAEPPRGLVPSAVATPTPVADPPVPAELPPLSPDFQASMASSQLQTYRYSQLAEQALALKKLCETGFGPPDLCPKSGPAGSSNAAIASPAEFPTVLAIDGAGSALAAILALPDGRRMRVRPGTILPGGLIVTAVTGDDVRVRIAPGREEHLAFGEGPVR